MLRAAVLDDYQGRAHEFADWGSLADEVEVTFFGQTIPREQLADTLAGFEVLVLMRERTAFPREVLERLPKLQLVVTTGMRNASLDVDHLREQGVAVSGTGMSGNSAQGLASTVEVAWALIFAVRKRVTLPADSELLSLENTVLLPHLGYVSEQAMRSMYADAVADIAAFVAGAPIRVLT